MTKAYVMVDSSTTGTVGEFASLHSKGYIGSYNGYAYNGGGYLVVVEILDPAAFDEIDANPKLTRLPNHLDPTPDAVKQKHIDKLHPELKEHLKAKGRLGDDGKLKNGPTMSGRELAEHIHDKYKEYTKVFHPDF